MPRRGSIGPCAAAAVALAALATAWAGLFQGVGGGRLMVLCLVGALPSLAALAPRARPAVIVAATLFAVVAGLALATRASLWDLVTLDDAAWSAVGALLPDGLAAGSEAGLPVSPATQPALVALLEAALALLAAAAAWQIVVRRRPVLGLVVVGVGLAYRWTVEPPSSGALAGASALAAVMLVLALSGWEPGAGAAPLRHLGGAAVLGAVTVVVATGLGAGPAGSDDAWWAWERWDLGSASSDRPGGLDVRQRYGALDWPETPRVAFTVATDQARPLRAVSLGDFDGVAFTLPDSNGSRGLPVSEGRIAVPEAVGGGPIVTQDVRLVATSTPVVLTSGRPVQITGPFSGTAALIGDTVRVEQPLGPGDRYTVRTRVPQPSPAILTGLPAYDPAALPGSSTRLRATYWGPPVDVPVWGTFGPVPTDADLGPYAPVRALARRVVGDARTPYAAVNRIEAYLRAGYTYDEQPPFPTSLPPDWPAGQPADDPPLADFLLDSRRGFCQQFAGAMAVMLRSVGIPSRVAVGYTGGTYDSELERYRVLDRDAHSWVEVWFPDYGWLPFDPTPGRYASNPASVSSPDYAPTRIDIDVGGLADAAVDPPAVSQPAIPELETPAAPATEEPVAQGGGGGGVDRRWALVLLAVPAMVAPSRRALRRARGRRGGDERTRVVAAARELEASLAPLGWAPPASASPTERAEAIRVRTGVDPSSLYRRAATARFAPQPPPHGEAAAAWRELAGLSREIRRGAPRRRRLLTALGIRLPVRDTVA